jgi:3-hydroxybutyryl-CoA dehydrogenase
MADITRIAVIGSGTVGTALAELAAANGIEAVTSDARGAVPALDGCQLVIEAVAERFGAKQDVLTELAKAAPEGAVLVTTTSCLSVTDLALAAGIPARLVGLNLALPADARTLAETVRTPLAAEAAVAAVVSFAEAVGRTVAEVSDRPGLITTRLIYGYLNHAVSMVEAGYATAEDVDAAMRYGCGYPVGPIAAIDAIGLDVFADALSALYAATGERVHAPAPMLKQLIAAGRLGQKSGKGFYTYAAAGSAQVVAAEAASAAGEGTAPREVNSVGVVGSGTMATGIIEVFAKSGFDVTFVARGEEKVQRVVGALTKSLDKQVARGRLAEGDRDAILGRVSGLTSVDGLEQVDMVVEAVVEDLEVKAELFRNLDRICKRGAVLATTTSSLPVIEMAAVTSRPQDVVGLHFFNPAPIMKLVEIVSTIDTGADVIATARDICARTKKVSVECGDRGGFIVNALLFPYLNDAVRMMDAHYATKEQIDAAIKAATGFPMGPFALLDVVGNDVSLAIQEVLLAEFNNPGFEPAKSLTDVVAAGFLGRKTGRGFYDYAR